MNLKLTDEQILESLENKRDDQTLQDIAIELGFTSGAVLSRLIKRLKNKIHDYMGEMVAKYAIEQIHNLRRNAKKGDTKAALALLEMAGVYILASKQKVDQNVKGGGKIEIIMRKIDEREIFGTNNNLNNNGQHESRNC
ncbi:MAG: hypothetical protein HWN67_21255 [Candidatus Helarchaeota archaeon]|nr:hypothetical protein [Candidatus Helarchaeota archaeon]